MRARSTPSPLLAVLLGLMLSGATALAAPAGGKSKPIDPANMDTAIRPGVDFYRYANGKWLDNNPIPASESRWGAFSEVQEGNFKILHAILEEAAAAKGAKPGSPQQMVGDFYASAMDSARAEKDAALPLEADMKRIAAIQSKADLQAELARLQVSGVRVPFPLVAGQDSKQSTSVVMQTFQGGLSLPDRDYYTKQDEASKKLRD